MPLNFIDPVSISQIEKTNDKTRPLLTTALVFGVLAIIVIMYLVYRYKLSMDDIELIIVLPGGLVMFSIFWADKKARDAFWHTFAKINNATHYPKTILGAEAALMLNQGEQRSVEHLLFFKDQELSRLFSYSFSKKKPYQKNATRYTYLVFGYTFEGKVPHVYLNYRHNSYAVGMKETLPLPAEFEKNFEVSVPRKYEIEALQIFTPELLAAIIDLGINTDIEIVEGEVLFYVEAKTNFLRKAKKDLGELQRVYQKVETLYAKLKPKLDTFSYHQIGDMPSQFISH